MHDLRVFTLAALGPVHGPLSLSSEKPAGSLPYARQRTLYIRCSAVVLIGLGRAYDPQLAGNAARSVEPEALTIGRRPILWLRLGPIERD